MQFSKVLPWMLLLMGAVYVYNHSDHLQDMGRLSPTPQQQAGVTVNTAPERHSNGDSSALQGPVSYANAVDLAAPAVVNIYTTQTVAANALTDPMLRRYFGGGQGSQQQASLGSGVIVSADGYILTNNHVVAGADAIVVALKDGRKVKATVIGADPDSDLAVIKVDLSGLPALPFRSTPIHVGDVVLAIGDPFGVGQTVTQGIISALGRQGLGINTYEDFIQTDAAINPGNSGGALVDVYGNLVGINSAIYSRSGGNMGIGFAIPVSLAKDVMTSIIQGGKVVRGWLGVEVRGPDAGPDQALNTSGGNNQVVVSGIVNDGPAGRAGMQVGDVINSINGDKADGPNQVVGRIATLKPGSDARITVSRNGQTIDLVVHIGERPPQPRQLEGEGQ